MGKGNPSSGAYVGAYTASITNQFTAGGNKKAGSMSGGVGHSNPFIVNVIGGPGRSNGRAPTVAGPYYMAVHKKEYPVSCVNQLGNIGGRFNTMFSTGADGVNTAKCDAMRVKVNAYNAAWPMYGTAIH
jgi:hypothetical protein